MDKKTVYIGSSIGGALGGAVPMLFGADGLSLWSILGALVGGLCGIFIVYKFSQ